MPYSTGPKGPKPGIDPRRLRFPLLRIQQQLHQLRYAWRRQPDKLRRILLEDPKREWLNYRRSWRYKRPRPRAAEREARPLGTPAGIALEGGLGEAGYALLWAGKVTVQDETHQRVAPLLEPQPGQRLVDLCAAPGGKATHLAELLGDQGRVDALDVEEERVARITSATSRNLAGGKGPFAGPITIPGNCRLPNGTITRLPRTAPIAGPAR